MNEDNVICSNKTNIVTQKISILTMEDYEYASSMGYNPLIDWVRFEVDFALRQELELELFGQSYLNYDNIPQANQKFYIYAYENTLIKCCEECMQPLEYYSATYVSHILSRKGYPEIAHDLRNFNLLCPRCHKQWETNYSGMKIRKKNEIVINLILSDHRNL